MAKVTVKKGDTLSKIAKAYNTSVSAIASANKIKDVNKIYAGQSISIPGSSSSSVKSSSTPKQSTASGIYKPDSISSSKGSNMSTSSTPLGSVLRSYKKPTFSSSSSKTKVGSFIDNTINKLSSKFDSLNQSKRQGGSVLDATLLEGADVTGGATDIPSNIELLMRGQMSPSTFTSEAVKDIRKTSSGQANNASAYEEPLNSQLIDLSLGVTPSIEPDKVYEADKSAGSVLYNTEGTNDTRSGSTTGTSTPEVAKLEPTMESTTTTATTTPSNPVIINALNTANNNLGVRGSSANDPFLSRESRSEFQNGDLINYANTAAGAFTTPEEAMNYLNSPQGMVTIKPFLDKGGKVEDIVSKVQVAKNGILPPQSFDEFISRVGDLDTTSQVNVNEYVKSKITGFTPQTLDIKNVPEELKNFVDAQNKQAILDSTYLSTAEKMMYEQAYNDKISAQYERDALLKIAEARETAIERKTDIAIKQYKAAMKEEEAEIEQARITSKKNLTEFLAQIGALRTDGNAQLGIETLEQKYQAQKSSIRAKYNTLIGNLEADANEKISELQYGLQKDTLELYRDLNKSDRELRMDVMKMQYQYQSDVLKANTSYQEKLSDLKIKQSSEASRYSNAYSNQLLELMMDGLPEEVAKSILTSKGEIIPKQSSVDTINKYSTKTKTNEYKFSKDEQSQLLKAGETSDSIAQLQSDISKYGVETVINDAGVDKQTRKALKTIFGL